LADLLVMQTAHDTSWKALRFEIPTHEDDKALAFAQFAKLVAADPGRYRIGADDAAELLEAVQQFVDLNQQCMDRNQRTTVMTIRKNTAMHTAQKLMRQWVQWIKVQPPDCVSPADKMDLGFVMGKM
jgi:hypothetical protein